MFRNFAAAVAALLMVGLGPAAQAQEVKVFHDFIFGHRHAGVDDDACFAEQAAIFKKLKKQKRMFERPEFHAFKKQRRIVKRAVKAYRKECGEVTALVAYLDYDPETTTPDPKPDPKPEPKPEPDPDPVDPEPDTDDDRDDERSARVVVDIRFGKMARTSECYQNMKLAGQSLTVHHHIVDAARGGDLSMVGYVRDTYAMVVDWIDSFKDADCGPVKVTVERMTF